MQIGAGLDLARVVPLAFVMIAGPQIVSAIMFATGERPRRDSLAYGAGAVVSTIAGTSAVYLLTRVAGVHRASHHGAGGAPVADYVLLALLALLAVRVFLRRAETEPPKWMGKLQAASPGFAFRLGLLLFLVMPTDAMTLIAVGEYLASHGHSLLGAAPFVLLTALLVWTPLIVLVLMGRNAETLLPRLRDWMGQNSWIVGEAVIGLFLVLELRDVLGG